MAGSTRVEYTRVLFDKCEVCQGEMMGARSHKRFCSPKCRKKSSRIAIAFAALAAAKKKKAKNKKAKKGKIKP